nr:hypothetical protein Iba_chr03cCG2240 [Ipomoea batatas]
MSNVTGRPHHQRQRSSRPADGIHRFFRTCRRYMARHSNIRFTTATETISMIIAGFMVQRIYPRVHQFKMAGRPEREIQEDNVANQRLPQECPYIYLGGGGCDSLLEVQGRRKSSETDRDLLDIFHSRVRFGAHEIARGIGFCDATATVDHICENPSMKIGKAKRVGISCPATSADFMVMRMGYVGGEEF